jgi:hypothetical protein
MRVKTCTRCGETKPIDQFPAVKRSEPERRQGWCRGCFAAANARNYQRNIERERARLYRNAARRREESQRRAIEHLLAHPCVDCGETDIVVLQFDHLHNKSFDVSVMISNGASWPRIEAEIAKCEVRCANCHHRKTAKERGYRKLSATMSVWLPSALEVHPPVQMELGTGEMLTCRVCHVAKAVTEFPYRSPVRGTRQYICRPCRSEYHRQWWAQNRVAQMPRIRRNRKKRDRDLEQRIWDILLRSPCVDCGETDLAVLHFDHLRDKVEDISTMWRRQRSWTTIELEIAKCEVRCANCHARKTARELGNYKTKVV